MTRRQWSTQVAFIIVGSLLALMAVSRAPLWRVERPTGHIGEMFDGTFLEFLGDLPRALENLGTPQTPEHFLSVLPTVYLWRNLGITLLVLAVGGVLGYLGSFGTNMVAGVFRKRAESNCQHPKTDDHASDGPHSGPAAECSATMPNQPIARDVN